MMVEGSSVLNEGEGQVYGARLVQSSVRRQSLLMTRSFPLFLSPTIDACRRQQGVKHVAAMAGNLCPLVALSSCWVSSSLSLYLFLVWQANDGGPCFVVLKQQHVAPLLLFVLIRYVCLRSSAKAWAPPSFWTFFWSPQPLFLPLPALLEVVLACALAIYLQHRH